MARLLLTACLVLLAVLAVQARPENKGSEVKALKKALVHAKARALADKKREMTKSLKARAMSRDALRRRAEAALSKRSLSEDKKPESTLKRDKLARELEERAMMTRALKRHLAEDNRKRQMKPEPRPKPTEEAKPQEPEGSGSWSDWMDSWSLGSDFSELEWQESWGPMPSWVPDSWFAKPEEKTETKRHMKPEPRPKPTEEAKPQEPEGSGSWSEWKDSWSVDSDFSELEWQDSWGPMPSWVPDSWFATPEEKLETKRLMKPEPRPKPTEEAKPQEPEGSGSWSEWKDSWSLGSDFSELEWQDSWRPMPSWVPDSWFAKPEEKQDKPKAEDRRAQMLKTTLRKRKTKA